MNEETLLTEYYEKMAPIYDKIFFGKTEEEFDEVNQYVMNLLENWCPEQLEWILEVGCGTGFWLEYLARIRTAHIVGVDISTEMLAIAADRCKKNPKIELHEEDARNLSFLEDNSIDFIFCIWVLQHLISPEDFKQGLKELARVTKPEGILLLADDSPPTKAPFTDCLLRKDELGGIYLYEDHYEGMTLPIYRRLLSTEEMTAALKETGLNLLSHEEKISLKVYVTCPQK